MTRAVATGLLCAWCAASAPFIHVYPAASSISLRGATTISLAVQNDGGAPTVSTIRLEWLDPRDTIRGTTVESVRIGPGKSNIVVVCPLPKEAGADALWYRLRYRIHTDAEETGGILTVANASREVFDLRVASPATAVPGGTYRITVVATTVAGGLPVEGVLIQGRLGPLKASSVTDSRGAAALEVTVPSGQLDALNVRIEGRLGDFVQSVSTAALVDRGMGTRIDFDKPIYQPGQTLHMRFLCRDHAQRAAADRTLSVSISGPQKAQTFTATLETDRFGVAAVDWNIPLNQRLGEYRIQAGDANRIVKISRYELPSFTVTTIPDRPYYLPGRNATVEVRAQYLFGKPVPGATVRVVREGKRETVEGQTDASGIFRAHPDLHTLHKELRSPDNRYLDATYTAYVTDPTSGRTEEQRFDLRATAEGIHLYVLPAPVAASHYVAASYPDGSPAQCRVSVNGGAEITTNRYGLARLPAAVGSMDLRAEDGQGARGHLFYNVWWPARATLLTDKTIYRESESIRATVRVRDADRVVIVDLSSQGRPLVSLPAQSKDGSATVEIPWRKGVAGAVTLTVAGEWDAARTVLFPPADPMKLDVHMAKTSYRPGEEAAVSFTARSADGEPLEAALGVAVVDAAVGARVRGDAGFAKPGRIPAGPETLPALPRDDLEHIDFSHPIPADLDLLAEVLVAAPRAGVRVDRSPGFQDRVQQYFQTLVNQGVSYVTEALTEDHYREWPRDEASLWGQLAESGIDVETLRDPWGNRYHARFGVDGRFQTIQLVSAGPDHRFETADDLATPAVRREWFAPQRHAITVALRSMKAYPENEGELRAALKDADIDLEHVTDPWGNHCAFRLVRDGPRGLARTRLMLHSAGPDHTLSTGDDLNFTAAAWDFFTVRRNRIADLLDSATAFPRTRTDWGALLQSAGFAPLLDPWGRELSVQFETRNRPWPNVEVIRLHSPRLAFDVAVFYRLPGARFRGEEDLGSIEGLVTDASGAVAPGAKVTLLGEVSSEMREVKADDNGRYGFDALIPGVYEVRFEMRGFQRFVSQNLLVYPGEPTEVNATLSVGAVSETITVEAAPPVISTSMASLSTARTVEYPLAGQRVRQPKPKPELEQGTPPVREYFPETLVWAPRLATGLDGRARLDFKLAGSITTWKLEAIASTEAGVIETASVDIRAFQPFFVDHNLPPILTEGDEIQLPVAVRNYEKREQAVDLTMRPAGWAELRGAAERQLRVAAGQSATEEFSLRAAHPAADGTLRLDAAGGASADAIERKVTVHPDHRRSVATASGLLSDSFPLDVALPADIIGQPTAELKVYSSLLEHVVESIAGGLQRPYGCGEQTTSSTYPSLMLLRLLKSTGGRSHPRAAEAAKYLGEGVSRLAGYRGRDGGFTYWGTGPSDVSLTAYVLGFLTAAKEFAPVQDNMIPSANAWLAGRQAPDGSWSGGRTLDGSSAGGTAAIALALARAGGREPAARALRYLAQRGDSASDAYTTASAALLALELGDRAAAAPWLDRLRRTVKKGGGRWEFDGETPFHAWGLPGQLEASALAVQALIRAGDRSDAALVADGLAFLLGKQDQYGIWYSGHTTVQVLDAVLAAAGNEHPAQGRAQLVVNGHPAGFIELPAAGEIGGPATIAIPAFLHAGANRIGIQNSGGAVMQAQIVATYYGPWTSGASIDLSSPIRMRVDFDKTNLRVGERVTCRVDVARKRGTGMLLAEIGLPPGVDVDRTSLEDAKTKSNGIMNSFEVLPDRLIVYLWPADRASFSFRFQPRFAMSAKSAPSEVYDYYNPEARSIVAPVKFRVE